MKDLGYFEGVAARIIAECRNISRSVFRDSVAAALLKAYEEGVDDGEQKERNDFCDWCGNKHCTCFT